MMTPEAVIAKFLETTETVTPVEDAAQIKSDLLAAGYAVVTRAELDALRSVVANLASAWEALPTPDQAGINACCIKATEIVTAAASPDRMET